jgi:hypothetical protein
MRDAAAALLERPLSSSLLLTSRQMASYVADGILRLDALVPDEINRRVMTGYAEGRVLRVGRYSGVSRTAPRPFTPDLWTDDDPLREVFALDAVRAAIRSVVGPDPLVDHHATHIIPPGSRGNGDWHPDSEMEMRARPDFLLMYFPHDTPREMGGTMVLPGSHLHTVRCQYPSRYDNYLGQRAMVCPAGTIALLHPAIWHCGQPNRGASDRLMYKIRFCPGPGEAPSWNTDDLDHPDVYRTLAGSHAWQHGDHQPAIAQRLRWWRSLSGRDDIDIGCWLVRHEYRHDRLPVRVTRGGRVADI